MNFFREQDRAKKKTIQLLLLLALAVTCLVVVTVLTLSAGLYFFGLTSAQTFGEYLNNQRESGTLAWIALTLVALIAFHSYLKWRELGSGGDSVAKALGGRRLEPGNHSPEEARLLNVVEEMAIASGNPVPRVYVLKGRSINAFAAGTNRHNAVIGVTEGCMQQLTREQLQGVIAHEFSHIHFGDMLLNHRLVSLLHGILIIGFIGEGIMYAAYDDNDSHSKFNKVYLFGWIIVLIGSCGTFFGNLIKAAVSRQREFLADAAAVQFTRNPDGITDALRKIGGSVSGSRIESSHAAEYSHFYFAQGVRDLLTSGLDTHPPLKDRIRRIQPRWDGSYIAPKPQPAAPSEERAPLQPIPFLMGGAVLGGTPPLDATASAAAIDAAAEEAIAAIGNPTPEHMAYAHALIDGLPEPLFNAAHQVSSVTCLMYGLIIQQQKHSDPLALLATHISAGELNSIEPLLPAMQQLQRRDYLPLIELAMPALKELDKPQYQSFKKALAQLIRADKKVSLFEWCLYRCITANMEERKVRADKKLSALAPEIITLLHALCYANNNDLEKTVAAVRPLLPFLPEPLVAPPTDKLSLAALDQALAQLARIRPLEKPRLLKAIAQCIELDNKVSAEEAELFRVIADSLNCPMPPLLGSKSD